MVGFLDMFSLLGTFMLNQMPSFKRKTFRVYVLKLNEDPVREMTICHDLQHEEKYPRTCRLT